MCCRDSGPANRLINAGCWRIASILAVRWTIITGHERQNTMIG
jgi:hypothetical protein